MSNTLIRKVAHYLTTPMTLGGQEAWRREPAMAGMPATTLLSTGGRAALPDRNPYVSSEVLEHFQHAFDAEELWRSARTQTRLRGGLRAVINAHPHLGDRRLPTSIVLEFPEELIEHDNRIGGNSTATLLAGLTELYTKDNQDRLKAGETPRFTAMTAADLPPHQIRVRMGAAIYVPGAGDEPAWKVQSSPDGAIWADHCTYLIPSGQRLWILGGSPDFASAACFDWPFPCELGVAMVARPDSPDLLLSSQPLKELKIAFNAELRCYEVTRARKLAGSSGQLGIPPCVQGDDAEPVLYLRTERLLPVALDALPSRNDLHSAKSKPGTTTQSAMGRPVAIEILPNQQRLAELTSESVGLAGVASDRPATRAQEISSALPSAETEVPPGLPVVDLVAAQTLMAQPSRPFASELNELDSAATLLAEPPTGPTALLSLEGIALQRPSNFRSHGVRGLQFGISAQGSVVAADSPLRTLRFDVSSHDEVLVTTTAGTRSLVPGDALPLAKGKHLLQLQSLPEELQSHYVGWLRLPLGEPVALARGETMGVGRQLESLRPLQPLAGTGFLREVPAMAGDQMGMSRRHFELQADFAEDGGVLVLEVRPLGVNTVVELDAKMRYVGTATAGQPIKLRPGHCLVVGHYVWRFSESVGHDLQ